MACKAFHNLSSMCFPTSSLTTSHHAPWPSLTWEESNYHISTCWLFSYLVTHSTCSSSGWKILTWQYSYSFLRIQIFPLLWSLFGLPYEVCPLCSHEIFYWLFSSHLYFIAFIFLPSQPVLSNRNKSYM